MNSKKVLIIDDDHDVLLTARMFLEHLELDVTVLSNPEKIIPLIGKESFDVILLDMNFQRGRTEGIEGLSWLQRIKEDDPRVVVILMTAFDTRDVKDEASQLSVDEYVNKPFDLSKIIRTVDHLIGGPGNGRQ